MANGAIMSKYPLAGDGFGKGGAAMQHISSETIQKAKQGDQEAAIELYHKTERMVFFTALKLTRNEDAARDISQDAYVKVYASLPHLREDGAFIKWLQTIVLNLSKDYLRKSQPDLFVYAEDEEQFLQSIPETKEDFLPEDYIENREKTRLIMEFVDSLPDAQRMSVMLYYYNQCSIREVAEIMGVAENTVMSRLNYARKRIKDCVVALEKEGTKLYGLPLFPLTEILFKASLEYSVPQAVSEQILYEVLNAAETVRIAGAAAPLEASQSTQAGSLAKLTARLTTKKISIATTLVVVCSMLVLGSANLFLKAADNNLPTDGDQIKVELETQSIDEPNPQNTQKVKAERFIVGIDNLLGMNREDAIKLIEASGASLTVEDAFTIEEMEEQGWLPDSGVEGTEDTSGGLIYFDDKTQFSYTEGYGVTFAYFFNEYYDFRGIRVGMNRQEVKDTVDRSIDKWTNGHDRDDLMILNSAYFFGIDCIVHLIYNDSVNDSDVVEEFFIKQ